MDYWKVEQEIIHCQTQHRLPFSATKGASVMGWGGSHMWNRMYTHWSNQTPFLRTLNLVKPSAWVKPGLTHSHGQVNWGQVEVRIAKQVGPGFLHALHSV